MTTTNIAGMEIPDEALAEAARVADEFDEMMPRFMALLERVKNAFSAIEIADHETHRFNRYDDLLNALDRETARGRLLGHFHTLVELDYDDMYTDEYKRLMDIYYPPSPGVKLSL